MSYHRRAGCCYRRLLLCNSGGYDSGYYIREQDVALLPEAMRLNLPGGSVTDCFYVAEAPTTISSGTLMTPADLRNAYLGCSDSNCVHAFCHPMKLNLVGTAGGGCLSDVFQVPQTTIDGNYMLNPIWGGPWGPVRNHPWGGGRWCELTASLPTVQVQWWSGEGCSGSLNVDTPHSIGAWLEYGLDTGLIHLLMVAQIAGVIDPGHTPDNFQHTMTLFYWSAFHGTARLGDPMPNLITVPSISGFTVNPDNFWIINPVIAGGTATVTEL